MGILNVTPDSFSDGGNYLAESDALRRTEGMLNEGAAIIDVGGESTRPRGRTYGAGASFVEADLERQRVIPVIRAIASHFPEAIVSIDTYKPAVAREALEAGAHLINDITGLRLFPDMADVAASYGVPLILMHSLGTPGEMPHEQPYQNVVDDVREALGAALRTGERAGVQHMAVDPGFGFGKSPAENLALINRVDALATLGRPILVGISRKSTIGMYLGSRDRPAPVDERLYGSLGATAVAVFRGASLVRTHDVRPAVELLRLLGATLNA